MFDDMVESTSKRGQGKKTWTLIVSAVFQVSLLAVLLLIPLIYTEALPKAMLSTMLVAPPPPPPPPPPPAAAVVKIVKPVARLIQAGKMMAPTVIPKKVNIIKESELPPDVGAVGVTGGVAGGIPGGSAGGVLGGIIGGVGAAPPPPPPAATPKRVRVGGNVQQANLINKVIPQYPAIAKSARIQGTVVLHAIIAKDGTVQELTYVSGPTLLIQSAEEAVKQWRYRPTLLNGEPVEVETTISVVFSLGG
jgi:periplasmic protein TonB